MELEDEICGLTFGLRVSRSYMFGTLASSKLTISSTMASPKQQNIIVAGTSQGDTTIDVHKLLSKRWYQYPHLRRLYAWMSVVLLVQATNGLDGSIMNGMQTLTYWNKYLASSVSQ